MTASQAIIAGAIAFRESDMMDSRDVSPQVGLSVP